MLTKTVKDCGVRLTLQKDVYKRQVILSAKSKGSEDMKQILIVEDDSFLNKMVAYNLTADGDGVTSALNARAAAVAIRQREFDLVLLDINLPDGNGFELCKLIKPQHPDTIVKMCIRDSFCPVPVRSIEIVSPV